MHRVYISLALLTAVLLIATAAEAGDEGRAGSTGATELRIPVGARQNAIGGAVVGQVDDVHATYWNPSGIANIDGNDAAYTYTKYFADMDMNWVGFATETGVGHFGFAAKLLSVGDIIVTNELAPNGTGEIINPTFSVVGITYAKEFTDRVLIGTTFNMVHERVLQMVANGVSFDFGFQYQLAAQGLSFGMAIKNIGPKMQFSGGDLETTFIPSEGDPSGRPRTFSSTSSTFELPAQVAMGVTYLPMRSEASNLMLSFDFQSNAFSGDEFRGGVEYGVFAGQSRTTQFMFRGGWSQADQTDFLLSGGTVGLGLGWKMGEALGRLDWSLNFLNSDFRDFFDDLNTVSLGVQF